MESTLKQQFLTEEEFYEIISKGIPPSQQVLAELDNFISKLQDAFDDANPKANEFLNQNGRIRKANRQLYPHLIRFLVHNYLRVEGIKTKLVNEDDEVITEDNEYQRPIGQPDILASNGIAGRIKGYNYRVLKALNGKLPPPGSSDMNSPKRRFYCQDHLETYQPYLIPPDKPTEPISKPNIIFLWDVDRKNFIKLYLSVPKWGNEIKAVDYYTELIPHPVTKVTPDIQEIESHEEFIHDETMKIKKKSVI